jgi:phenylacetic acid degradation operon negative regulatory protein
VNDEVSAPRIERPRRSRSAGAVAFLFAVADANELAGPVLVRLLGDLGLSESAARGQLGRMRRAGQLVVAQRSGRQVTYRLSGPFAVGFERLRSSGQTSSSRWTGQFHVLFYQVPETERAFRDRLRRTAQLVGYGSMQPGVLLASTDLSGQLNGVIAQAPPGCVVQLGQLRVPDEDAVTLATVSWDLAHVADVFRAHLAPLSAALHSDPPPPTREALRRLAELLLGPQLDRLSDPGLPAELLPDDWPGSELVEAVRLVGERYLPPAHAYVHSVAGGTEAARS